ncbi:hypothetical protein [Pseudovibrio denitrificans]|uniref:hypothetical protein n=1 Tax=Pseudovibrio denitrificans TaxID=258256 RepID=UPI001AD8CEA1|nr:hypothetical protein [Pseudovibrio denitrificans]
MEIVAQRPTLLHQALTTQAAPVKSDTEQVKTELAGAQAVTASSESSENSTASEKSYLSDSRLGIIPSKPKGEESRVERGYNYDEESEELIYAMTQQPEGEVIYELPSKTLAAFRPSWTKCYKHRKSVIWVAKQKLSSQQPTK